MVITTRADPPLPLARLRGRGQLAELCQADLRGLIRVGSFAVILVTLWGFPGVDGLTGLSGGSIMGASLPGSEEVREDMELAVKGLY
jgi:hypothetical protein